MVVVVVEVLLILPTSFYVFLYILALLITPPSSWPPNYAAGNRAYTSHLSSSLVSYVRSSSINVRGSDLFTSMSEDAKRKLLIGDPIGRIRAAKT